VCGYCRDATKGDEDAVRRLVSMLPEQALQACLEELLRRHNERAALIKRVVDSI
jgi:hypothetical protein